MPPGADGIWRARVTKTLDDGTTDRPLYSLGTTDRTTARRKLAQLVAAVERGDDIPGAVGYGAPERVKDFCKEWLDLREGQGIASVDAERRYLERFVVPTIGNLPLGDVAPPQINGILTDLASSTYTQGKARQVQKSYRGATVKKLRGILHALFRTAQADGKIHQNPVAPVRTPSTAREIRKDRTILTDSEFETFIACPKVDLELRMMSLVARVEGGMRASDVNGWDWTMIDRVHFAECDVPRTKTRHTRPAQRLAIPPALVPFLRMWWEQAGKPESGPVFPVRRGKRAGASRTSGGGFAARLRRDLFRAGVYRMTPVEVPATKPGMRTDLGKGAKGTKLAPSPRDPLYFETATTLPVDFHSFRRAFNTALAEAGVNVQHAMHLAAHTDPKVHARYVMRTTAMRTIPDAAIPRLPAALAPGIVTARDDSTLLAVIASGKLSDSSGRSRDRTCDFVRVNNDLSG